MIAQLTALPQRCSLCRREDRRVVVVQPRAGAPPLLYVCDRCGREMVFVLAMAMDIASPAPASDADRDPAAERQAAGLPP